MEINGMKEYGSFKKNMLEIVKVYSEEYMGQDVIHIRSFKNDQDGKLKPTRKGISFTPEKLKQLIPIIWKAQCDLEKMQSISAEQSK
ncbi:transcriptional coactivator p15/PC4 family protein [candidate division KSB1 bacterium]